MLTEDIAIKNPIQRFDFTLANLAVSQTDAVVPRNANTNGVLMPWNGSVLTLAVALSAAKTAGTLTFTITKNGTATPFTLTVANGVQYVFAKRNAEVFRFLAGDRIGVTFSSDASLAPAGSLDVTADVYVLFEDVEP